MLDWLAQQLQQTAEFAAVWWPLLILFLMTLESSVFPVPSEAVMIPAGFMAARAELLPQGLPLTVACLAVLCGVVGSILGAYLNYWVSLKLGRPLLYKYGKWFFLKPAALARAEEIFREYGDGATFVGRLLPVIRHLISIPAGLSRMHFGRFTLYTATGAGLWCAVLTAMGYWFGLQVQDMTYVELLHRSVDILHRYRVWIVLGGIAFMGGYVWLHHRVMRRSQPGATPPAA